MDWSYAVVFALGIAIVKAVESELKAWGVTINERLWLYIRALVAGGATALLYFYPAPVPDSWLAIMGIVATMLGVLGYWPEVQKVGARLKQEEAPKSLVWKGE